jgi:uncharacterized protein
LIGLIHGFFIWFGDILFIYSVTAFAACFLVDREPKVRRGMAALGIVLSILMGVGFFALGVALPADFLNPAAGGSNEYQLFTVAEETRIYAQGSYGQQLGIRAMYFTSFVCLAPAIVLPLLPLFLIGRNLAEGKVLERPSAHPAMRDRLLWIGFGIGLPLNLLALVGPSLGLNWLAYLAWETLFGPIMAFGYLILGAMWVESGRGAAVQAALAKVGKTAMSCYLLQSILGTFVFYSYGLGLFGALRESQMLLVVVGIWIVVLCAANLWLRRFSMGPAEWLLRSLTEGRHLPILRRTPVAAAFEI